MDPSPGSRVRVESGNLQATRQGDLMVSVHARSYQGTGIPPRPADQIDYHGHYLSDSIATPWELGFIYNQARVIYSQTRKIMFAI